MTIRYCDFCGVPALPEKGFDWHIENNASGNNVRLMVCNKCWKRIAPLLLPNHELRPPDNLVIPQQPA